VDNKYSFDDIVAYSIVALNNFLKSANKDNIDIENYLIFIEGLKDMPKEKVTIIYNVLIQKEKGDRNKKFRKNS